MNMDVSVPCVSKLFLNTHVLTSFLDGSIGPFKVTQTMDVQPSLP